MSVAARTLRAFVVAAITLWALATTLPDIALPWHPLSSYGFQHRGGVISSVRRGEAAQRAGLRVGDRINLRAMTPEGRRHLYGAVYANSAEPGTPLVLTIDRGASRRVVTLRPTPLDRSAADNVSDVILILSQCAFVLLAAWLAIFRPGVMTAAFFVYGLSTMGYSTFVNATLPVHGFVVQFGIASFLGGLRPAALALFAIRFPHDRARGWLSATQFALIPIGLALGTLGAYAGLAPTLSGAVTGSINAVVALAGIAVYAFGAAAFISTYIRSSRADRQRMKWLVTGFVAGFAGSTGFDVIRWFVPGWVSIPLYNSMYALNVLLPIALAYAVVKHRVIDVNFVVSRAVVYAILTTAIVAVFAFTDWLFSRYFISASLGTIAEIAIAVGLGFWFEALHRRVDVGVDALLFRNRHRAQLRLHELAHALPHAESIETVAEALVIEPAVAMELASAALFVRDESGAFARQSAAGWDERDIANISGSDLMVAQLQSVRRATRLRDITWRGRQVPNGAAAPVLALPIFVRRELRAFALYGAHLHGEDFDADEIQAIDELAIAASSALDHIEAHELRLKISAAQQRLNAVPDSADPLPEPDYASAASARSVSRNPGRLASGIAACALALFVIITVVPDLVRPWFPAGTAGVAIDNDDFVTRIAPGSGARAVGLQVGDRLDLSDFTTRIIWGWGSGSSSTVPGGTVHASFVHAGIRHTTVLPTTAERLPPIDAAFQFLTCAVGLATLLTALALVLFRPSLMTWGFFAYTLAVNPATAVRFLAALPPSGIIAFTLWVLAAFLVGNIGVAVFAILFPSNTVSPDGKRLLKVLLYTFIPTSIVYFYYVAVFPLYGITGGRAFTLLSAFITVFAYVIAMLAFIDTYLHASPHDRQRTKWVIVGFAIGAAGFATDFVLSDASFSALAIPYWVTALAGFTVVAIPITVWYAVIHYRVVDVRFAISRAVVFGALTTSMVAVFSVIDWFFGRELSATRLGTVAEIVVAIAIGFWLNTLHGHVNRLLDAVLFRRRREAEERLERIRRGLPFATSPAAIENAAVHEPLDALQLTSAALFVRARNGMFERRSGVGWSDTDARALHPDDPLMLEIQGCDEPVRLRHTGIVSRAFPPGERQPVLAVPLFAHSHLLGVAFYGPHASGSDIDAGELRSIDAVIGAAASAYEHIEALQLRAELERLSTAV